MKTILNRLTSESPTFFKRLCNVCIALGVIGGVIVASPVTLPTTIVTIGGYLLTVGAVGTAVSKLTVKNPEDLTK